MKHQEIDQLQAKLVEAKQQLEIALDNQPDLSISSFMEQFHCSRPTVYRYIRSGDLVTYKLGRATRITGESAARLRARLIAESAQSVAGAA